MSITIQILAAVCFIAILGILGAVDYSEALIADAIEKDARPQRVAAQDRSLPFAFPLDYKAVVCSRTYYSDASKCRFYAERSK